MLLHITVDSHYAHTPLKIFNNFTILLLHSFVFRGLLALFGGAALNACLMENVSQSDPMSASEWFKQTSTLGKRFGMSLEPFFWLPDCEFGRVRWGKDKTRKRCGLLLALLPSGCAVLFMGLAKLTFITFPCISFKSILSIASWASADEEYVTNAKPRCFPSGHE